MKRWKGSSALCVNCRSWKENLFSWVDTGYSVFVEEILYQKVRSTAEMWYCLFVCPTVDLAPSGIISEVLDDVEKRSFTPQDPDDGMNFNLSDSQVLEGAVVTAWAAVGVLKRWMMNSSTCLCCTCSLPWVEEESVAFVKLPRLRQLTYISILSKLAAHSVSNWKCPVCLGSLGSWVAVCLIESCKLTDFIFSLSAKFFISAMQVVSNSSLQSEIVWAL